MVRRVAGLRGPGFPPCKGTLKGVYTGNTHTQIQVMNRAVRNEISAKNESCCAEFLKVL
jgi:hypothetical protein